MSAKCQGAVSLRNGRMASAWLAIDASVFLPIIPSSAPRVAGVSLDSASIATSS